MDTKPTTIHHTRSSGVESVELSRSSLAIKHQSTAIIVAFSPLKRAAPLMDVTISRDVYDLLSQTFRVFVDLA